MTLPDHLIAANEYGRYCIPRSSHTRPAAATVLAGNVWEPGVIAFMARNCGAGDIVHAGAYFGDFLPGLSHALAPGARLWAFEPSSENHACAQKTVEMNGLANVSLFPAGLGARAETKPLYIASEAEGVRGGGSRIATKRRPGRTYEDVPVAALDDVVPQDRDVSILQLDVEGFEQKALKGALGTLRRCRPLLILEHLPLKPEWHERHILSLGYREVGTIHANRILTAAPGDPADFDTYRDRPRRRNRRPRDRVLKTC